MNMTSRIGVAVFGVAAFALSCTEFEQTNPFHPDFAMNVAVLGPDTVTSLNQPITFQVAFDPDWPDAPVEWEVTHPDLPGNLTGVVFLSTPVAGAATTTNLMQGAPITNRVTVRVGPRTAFKDIVGVVRFYRGEFACTTNCGAYIGESPGFVNAFKRDSLGNQADGALLPSDIAQSIVSRDTGVIKVQTVESVDHWAQTRFTAHAQGSTYLVFNKYGSDSVLVHSARRPAQIALSCPATVTVGQDTQFGHTLLDANGGPIAPPHTVRWSVIGGPGAGTGSGFFVGLTSGVLRAQAAGSLNILAAVVFYGQSVASGVTATCTVQANP